MSGVSAFFTAYPARRGDERVEAVTVIVDWDGQPASGRLVVVAEDGHASTASADELDLYGVIEDNYADPQTEPPSARLV